jgi:5-methylthioribose kinase
MQYYQLDANNLVGFLRSLPEMSEVFTSFEQLDIQEITDGNMNFAFIVSNSQNPSQSVFVKQAPPYIKVMGEDWPLTRERMAAEINTLNYHQKVCPKMVPKVYFQSISMSTLVMQNLSQCDILRNQLIAGHRLPTFADDLATFLAKSLYYSSGLFLSTQQKDELIGHSGNPAMCQITEQFVFTYPFEHHDMNDYNQELPQAVIDSIQKDADVRAQVAQMKYLFMTKKEALLHGDLHTGSIMVDQQQSFVIDAEFSFVGPMGFDLGALMGNLYLNYFCHAYKQDAKSQAYSEWILNTIEVLWQKFSVQFLGLWQQHEQTNQTAFMGNDLTGDSHQRFRETFMQQLLTDSLGFAACKMLRRILGVAKVADLMQFDDFHLRAKLETQAITLAKHMLLNRHNYKDLSAINALAQKIAQAA